jgi:cellulose synthase/poly-beta-1,6-N-acetylglucosamine synthase-like glycosyltransferase
VITSVGIVIPARNEQTTISPCLLAVRAALAAAPPTVRTAVCVVLDRCTDGTGDIVAACAPNVDIVVNRAPHTVGTIRDLGVRRVLSSLGDRAEQTWLLNTDADSVVPAQWLAHHLSYADRGAQAVAGLATIADWRGHDETTRRRYDDLVAKLRHGRWHEHVYGANLGVRADAYLAVGGFAAVSTGEDQDLWNRLENAGMSLARPTDRPVVTSGRTQGRAVGGVADLLRELGTVAPADSVTAG